MAPLNRVTAPASIAFRATLVTAQVAVSFVLLVGAALLLQSFHKLATVPLGYQLDHVMTADAGVFSDFKTQTTPADFERVYGSVLDELRAAPGVTAAGITSSIPLERTQPVPLPVSVAGATSEQAFKANQAIASDGYFEALGVRLVEGRLFRMADNGEAPRAAVINQAMARFWGQRPAIGSTFSFEVTRPKPAHIEFTVIGIVSDMHQYGVTESIGPQYYMSFRQLPPGFGFLGRFIVRTAGAPDNLAMTIKSAIHKVDPRMAVEDLRTLESVWDTQLASPRLTAGLLLIFAGLALVITLAGLAGRDRHVGEPAHTRVRIADGARRFARQRARHGAAARRSAGGDRPGRRHWRRLPVQQPAQAVPVCDNDHGSDVVCPGVADVLRGGDARDSRTGQASDEGSADTSAASRIALAWHLLWDICDLLLRLGYW